MKKKLAALAIGTTLAFGAANMEAAPPGPVITGGLVNLTLVDVVDVGDVDIALLNNVGVGVAANVAAQICGTSLTVPVGVLAAQVVQTGQATACEITGQDGDAQNVIISRTN